MDLGRELVPSLGRGGWSQVCQAAGDTSSPPGLPEMGKSWGGMRRSLHCSHILQPSARGGGRSRKLSLVLPVLPSYFSPFSLATETEISGVLSPPGCVLSVASLQRVLGWGWTMMTWNVPFQEIKRGFRKTHFQILPQPSSKIPLTLSNCPLPTVPQMSWCLPYLSCHHHLFALLMPTVISWLLYIQALKNMDLPERHLTPPTPCPSLPSTNTELNCALVTEMFWRWLQSWCVTGRCCGDERLSGKEFKTSCVCVCAHRSCLCLNCISPEPTPNAWWGMIS